MIRATHRPPTAWRPGGTLRDFFEEVFLPAHADDLPRNAAVYLRSPIKDFTRFAGEEIPIEAIDEPLLRRYLGDTCRRGLTPRTANRRRSDVLRVLRYAVEIGAVASLPAVSPLAARKPTRPPVAFTPAEFQSLIEAAGRRNGFVGEASAGDFWPAFFLLAANTGVRLNGLVDVATDNLDEAAGRITIDWQTSRKSHRRVFPLWPATLLAIEQLAPRRRGLPRVLGDWAWKRAAVPESARSIVQAAGLGYPGRDLFRMLRATYATWQLAEHGSMDRLGAMLAHEQHVHSLTFIDGRQLDRDDRGQVVLRTGDAGAPTRCRHPLFGKPWGCIHCGGKFCSRSCYRMHGAACPEVSR
jgi:integrase